MQLIGRMVEHAVIDETAGGYIHMDHKTPLLKTKGCAAMKHGKLSGRKKA